MALLRVAILVKYGGTIEEAAFKFEEAIDAIYTKHNADDESEPTLAAKLDALKASVGEETFNKLLANPEIERMAGRAYRKTLESRIDAAVDEILALFNGAIRAEDMFACLAVLTESEDPIRDIVEA